MNNRDRKFLIEAVRQMLIEASLNSTYKKQFSKKMSYEDYMTVCNIDPTTNGDNMGKYCLWLLRELQKEAQRADLDFHDFIQEYYVKEESNIRYLQEILSFYEKYKGKIKSQYPEYSDITKLNLSQFSLFVNEKKDEFESKQLEKFKSKDAECVYNDKDWQIIIPYTWEASKKYGANTAWCTTDRNDDYFFNKYSKTEPLFINIDKRKNVKYQFSINQRCFFNAADSPIAHDIYGAAKATNMPQNVLKFYETEVNEIIKDYRKNHNVQIYDKDAYKLALEYLSHNNHDLSNYRIFRSSDKSELIYDLEKDYMCVLGVCADVKNWDDGELEFVIENDEGTGRTIENFGHSLDSVTINDFNELVTIVFQSCTIDASYIEDYCSAIYYYVDRENNEKALIFVEDNDVTGVSLITGENYDDSVLESLSNEAKQDFFKRLPSEFVAKFNGRHFDMENATKVVDYIYLYNNMLYSYKDNQLNELIDADALEEESEYFVNEIIYANSDNGIIIYHSMANDYVIVLNGLDETDEEDAGENTMYDPEVYENEDFYNQWQVYTVMQKEPEIYQNDRTNNIAFNTDYNSIFSINNNHYSFDKIAEDFNEEVFLLKDYDVVSIYCGKIDKMALGVDLDSGDKFAYIHHEDNEGDYVRKVDIFSGEESYEDTPSDADNYYQDSDTDDEYSYHMAENIKKKFNNLFERINKNYNPNRLVE